MTAKINGEHGVILAQIAGLAERVKYLVSRVDQSISMIHSHGTTIQGIDSRCQEREKVNDAISQRVSRISSEVAAMGGDVDTGRIDLTRIEAEHKAREDADNRMQAERDEAVRLEETRRQRRLQAVVAIVVALASVAGTILAGRI